MGGENRGVNERAHTGSFTGTSEATFLEQDTPMAAKNSYSGFLLPGNLVGESGSPIPRCPKSRGFCFWLHYVSQRLYLFFDQVYPVLLSKQKNIIPKDDVEREILWQGQRKIRRFAKSIV